MLSLDQMKQTEGLTELQNKQLFTTASNFNILWKTALILQTSLEQFYLV